MSPWEKEIDSLRQRMEKVLENFKQELSAFHLGKASTALVENLKISYFGQEVPLNSLANIALLDVLNLVVEPYDPNAKGDIIQGLKSADLGCQIIEEGNRIRLSFPPLSEERKEELAKLLHQKKEEAKIALRREREETWKKIQEMEKEGEITEDDKYTAEKKLNELIGEFNEKVEEMAQAKEQEIKG